MFEIVHLTGLAEMFKTPVKEEPATSARPVALSENLLRKKSEVNVSGEKSAPPTSETLGWFTSSSRTLTFLARNLEMILFLS